VTLIGYIMLTDSRMFRWLAPLLVALVTSATLMALLDVASCLGGKAAVDMIARASGEALADIQPLKLYKEYQGYSSCDKSSEFARLDCLEQHRNVDWYQGLENLFGSLRAQPPAKSFIDIIQLLVGFAVAFVLLKAIAPELGILGAVPFVAFLGVIVASLLSVPMLLIMLVASSALDEILPGKSSFGILGGEWLGLVAACIGRTMDAGLHHAVERAVERVLAWFRS
jgi:hypothetical protein